MVMKAKDVVRGADAECFVTIDGNRTNLMTLKNFEASISYTNSEVRRLGASMVGHKPGIATGEWSATIYYGTPQLREVAKNYKATGIFPSIEIQVVNEDVSSGAGRQSMIFKDCIFNDMILAKFDIDTEYLDEEISGTFDDWDIAESFTPLAGM